MRNSFIFSRLTLVVERLELNDIENCLIKLISFGQSHSMEKSESIVYSFSFRTNYITYLELSRKNQ